MFHNMPSIHTNGRAADLHGLLKRYCAGELGVYVVVLPLVVHDGENCLVMCKHDVSALYSEQLAAPIASLDNIDPSDGYWDDSMLVGVVQVLKNPQRIIARGVGGSHIGLLRLDHAGYRLGDAVYHSARSGCVSFRGFEDRELMLSAVRQYGSVAAQDYELINQMVQGGSELVDCLTCKQGEIQICLANGGVLDSFETGDRTAFIHIFVHEQGVGFEISKGADLVAQVLDMGYGPL